MTGGTQPPPDTGGPNASSYDGPSMALPPKPPRPPQPGGLVVPLSPSVPSGRDSARDAAGPSSSDASTPLPPTLRDGGKASPRLELDPIAADLISRAISAAISKEIQTVRASLVPPPGDKQHVEQRPGTKPASEPPRSSIRVAAKGASKLGKWGTMGVGALALVGQGIVWFARPEYAAPISQAFKLLYLLFGGGSELAP